MDVMSRVLKGGSGLSTQYMVDAVSVGFIRFVQTSEVLGQKI
jgi:hypothetical protein